MRATLVAVLGLCACGAPEDPTDTRPHRAFVIGVDGLRPDALDAAPTPNLDAVFSAGVLSLTASTHLTGFTISGPGWASVLTGVEVEDHLVDSNDDLSDRPDAWPTFPQRAREAGRTVAACYDWLGILPLLGEGATDAQDAGTDEQVGEALASRISSGDYDLVFSHFDAVDHAGHASGFSKDNAEYLAAIASVDDNVAAALDAVSAREGDENWLIALVTDHGGNLTGHGARDADNMTIPVGVLASELEAGASAPATANQMDIAPTVMDWLDVPYEGLDGRSWLP